ncbi:hypothetical protein [Rhizobium leguminosarum]|uniref:hypothetical protein n=1 Tax=Rhizobium leguminosarum TaxID=384 RepID=UPI00103D9779|nr:hypothetical protein [Rhizobium leguminosarum]MBY5778988.1 hypothetical protein [Rhizobium leguminosarum]TBZ11480.1 hypothetical protein E0H33_22250 [Rhizobium leguminosarum bv. viciae]TBZ24738.1 hypothetical protein E0H38_06525 [Rhizobium leguminosarum bv. viciae]
MPTANPKIKRLDPETVVAPLLVRTPFKIIGSGFGEGMDVYVSAKEDGSERVDVEVLPDRSATSTDKVWPVVAQPALGAKPTDTTKESPDPPLWVVIKLNGQKSAIQGFLIV